MTTKDHADAAQDRLTLCKNQLMQCIDALSPKSRFTIFSFSDGVRQWQKNLQVASPANKAKAKTFVKGLVAAGMTHTLSALNAGFKVKGADAMVVLSDGTPTETDKKGQVMTEGKILAEIDAQNRFRKWRIDTFGFGAGGGQLGAFMKQLAESNGGKFTPIR